MWIPSRHDPPRERMVHDQGVHGACLNHPSQMGQQPKSSTVYIWTGSNNGAYILRLAAPQTKRRTNDPPCSRPRLRDFVFAK